MTEHVRHRDSHHLSHGRMSIPGATYFVTFCTYERKCGLADARVADHVLGELESAIAPGTLLIAGVMPDHVHALFTLAGRLSLSQTVARVKVRTSSVLRSAGLAWQRSFFDRRLRPEDSLESFALYIFLNRYRASLISLTDIWPGTRLGTVQSFRFIEEFRHSGAVRPEWMGLAAEFESSIDLGDF